MRVSTGSLHTPNNAKLTLKCNLTRKCAALKRESASARKTSRAAAADSTAHLPSNQTQKRPVSVHNCMLTGRCLYKLSLSQLSSSRNRPH